MAVAGANGFCQRVEEAVEPGENGRQLQKPGQALLEDGGRLIEVLLIVGGRFHAASGGWGSDRKQKRSGSPALVPGAPNHLNRLIG